ncbi:hypothetical protein DM860_009719 [Cuscuta australis]|uniref:Uncharacterized protein n=1 Tax=Cuscuta australis TaxID=267555 RepID=A0A328DAV3_9ASTE|nr:hypothetical protein DM860_009719 [Cuscuta australis]
MKTTPTTFSGLCINANEHHKESLFTCSVSLDTCRRAGLEQQQTPATAASTPATAASTPATSSPLTNSSSENSSDT